jgi:hypothetical protein
MSRVATCAVLLVALAAGGCGTGGDRAQARQVVERFYAAIAAHHPDVACRQLSASTQKQLESQSKQSCPSVIDRLQLGSGGVVGVYVAIINAKVDVRGNESAFLGKEPAGWRITAAGCKATQGKPRDRPLECEVQD